MSLLQQRFAGRTLAVATMHGKEEAIGPAMLQHLPLSACIAIPDLDTDRFGAFSGEVERGTDPRTAALHKAKHGAEHSGHALVIASEGSFVPYPPAPFVPCDEEWLVLYDARDGRSWAHRHVALETVAGGAWCATLAEVRAFAQRMRFPSHGLVLKPHEHWRAGDAVVKGLADGAALEDAAAKVIERHGAVWVESDLRAMMNPTRMGVIRTTADRFARELATPCPACGELHFAVAAVVPGLPCGLCGMPTEGVRAYRRRCEACGHTVLDPRPDGRMAEDPMHCANCNP